MAGLQLHHRMGMKGYTQGIVEGNGSAIFFWRESGSGLAIKGDGTQMNYESIGAADYPALRWRPDMPEREKVFRPMDPWE